MRTSAFATTAPLGSCTVPVIAPVAPPCAKAPAVSAKATTLITMNLIEERDMLYLPSPRLDIELCLPKIRFQKTSTNVGSAWLGQDTRGPHPRAISRTERSLFHHSRMET